jgi:hypothetical protein
MCPGKLMPPPFKGSLLLAYDSDSDSEESSSEGWISVKCEDDKSRGKGAYIVSAFVDGGKVGCDKGGDKGAGGVSAFVDGGKGGDKGFGKSSDTGADGVSAFVGGDKGGGKGGDKSSGKGSGKGADYIEYVKWRSTFKNKSSTFLDWYMALLSYFGESGVGKGGGDGKGCDKGVGKGVGKSGDGKGGDKGGDGKGGDGKGSYFGKGVLVPGTSMCRHCGQEMEFYREFVHLKHYFANQAALAHRASQKSSRSRSR